MNINFKLSLLSVFMTIFISACDSSASTDAKSIEVKKVAATLTTKAPEAISNNSNVQKDDVMKLDSSKFIEGKHYVRISPTMATDVTPGKIEVAELFWFGCPHCY